MYQACARGGEVGSVRVRGVGDDGKRIASGIMRSASLYDAKAGRSGAASGESPRGQRQKTRGDSVSSTLDFMMFFDATAGRPLPPPPPAKPPAGPARGSSSEARK